MLVFALILVGVSVGLFNYYYDIYLEKINVNILNGIEKQVTEANSLNELRLISNDLESLVYKDKQFPSYNRILEIEYKIQTKFEDILNNW